jgi:hypothetical protein
MSEPKFTKGPWVFCGCDKGMYQATDDGKRLNLLFSFDMSFVGISPSEHKANVALIKTSPKMYWMLEKCRTALHDCGMWCLSEDVFLLLKEARGEE